MPTSHLLAFSFSLSLICAALLGSPPAEAGPRDGRDTCVRLFVRQRACTAEFIPALVEARVKADKPAGIAETDRQQGRDKLVKQALEEWKSDSADAAIARTCASLALPSPALEQADACLAQLDCAGFVKCVIPALSSTLH